MVFTSSFDQAGTAEKVTENGLNEDTNPALTGLFVPRSLDSGKRGRCVDCDCSDRLTQTWSRPPKPRVWGKHFWTHRSLEGAVCQAELLGSRICTRTSAEKLDIRLPGKGNSNSRGARLIHQIISMIKLIRTCRLSRKNSLSAEGRCALPRRD